MCAHQPAATATAQTSCNSMVATTERINAWLSMAAENISESNWASGRSIDASLCLRSADGCGRYQLIQRKGLGAWQNHISHGMLCHQASSDYCDETQELAGSHSGAHLFHRPGPRGHLVKFVFRNLSLCDTPENSSDVTWIVPRVLVLLLEESGVC